MCNFSLFFFILLPDHILEMCSILKISLATGLFVLLISTPKISAHSSTAHLSSRLDVKKEMKGLLKILRHGDRVNFGIQLRKLSDKLSEGDAQNHPLAVQAFRIKEQSNWIPAGEKLREKFSTCLQVHFFMKNNIFPAKVYRKIVVFFLDRGLNNLHAKLRRDWLKQNRLNFSQ